MRYISNTKIFRKSKILENITIGKNNRIIDNNSDFFKNYFDNKSLENENNTKIKFW